ncbi:MAG TPA: glycosyltransferase, partial [Deltaproteobacteria bacterium]|nr:glycosyltransferase [Deltaproteobacteria bacterium]
TIVTRPLLDPDHAFLLLQHRIEKDLGIKLDFLSLRKKAEALVRKNLRSGADATLDTIYKRFGKISRLPRTTVERIKQMEVDTEIRLSLPRADMSDLVKNLRRDGKQLVFLSDMYLSSADIRRILAKHGIEAPKTDILVSSETGKRKDTGEAWKDFVDRVAQIHVGDNEHSDIQLPADRGIPHYHVMSPWRICELAQPKAWVPGTKTLADSMYLGPSIARLFSSPFALNKTGGMIHIANAVDMGYCVFGPILLAFTRWLSRESERRGITHLLFLAREGFLLKELFEMFAPSFCDKSARATYLLCSRRANSMSAIETEADIKEILEAPYQGTLANLIETRFGIDPEVASRAGGYSHEKLHEDVLVLPGNIDEVHRDILRLRDVILASAEEERSSYLAYLDELGVGEKGRTAVVDIGFAGTIQKYLQRLTGIELEGFYFVTNDKARRSPSCDNMSACFGNFVDGTQGNPIYNYSLLLEAVLTAPDGQFVRFDTDGNPVFGKNANTRGTWKTIRSIHQGIKEYFHDTLNWFGDALLEHEPGMEAVSHFFRLVSEHPDIIDSSLGNALNVDDFYVSSKVLNAFHYASPKNSPIEDTKSPSTPVRKHTKLVSIIILTYNQLEYTRRCIESIEQHTSEPFEIIFVDNGSSDGTVEFLGSYAETHDNVKLVVNRDNKGFA